MGTVQAKVTNILPRSLKQNNPIKANANNSIFFFLFISEDIINKIIIITIMAFAKGCPYKAEALKDSTDWKATADELTKLQKEWKTIGPVAKKYSDAIWKRFISACDYFFEQKNKATSSQRSVEVDNLNKKKEIIEKLGAIDENMDTNEATQLVRELMKEWNSIGHVPFKEKDRLYKQYHGQVDKLFDHFNISAANKKLSNFKSNISNIQEGSPQSLYREREKLVRAADAMRNELQTYENNLGFLTASSKKGNSLLTELNRKVEKLKADIELVKQKIKVIDDSIRSAE